MRNHRRQFAILLIAALVFTVFPIPKTWEFLRPCWVALLIIYWSLNHPRFLSLWSIFFIGLLMDALVGSLFGQHALGLIVMTALTLRFYRRIYIFPMPQQAVTIFLLIGVYQFMLIWVDGVAGVAHGADLRVWTALTSALVWPLGRALAKWRSAYA